MDYNHYGEFDPTLFKPLGETIAKAMRRGMVAKYGAHTDKHITYGAIVTDKRIVYVEGDGEGLHAFPDGTYSGELRPDYVLVSLRTSMKADDRRRYAEGKAKARDEAIEWQNSLKGNESWGEIADANERFRKLGRRYGLLEEFRENGII